MARQYPTAFRQVLVDRMLVGESALSLVAETGVLEQTLRRWKSQGRVDAGLAEDVTSAENQAPRDSLRRIKDLQYELALVKAAGEIFHAQVVMDPRDDRPSRWNSPRAATRFAGQPKPQAFPA